MPKFTWEAPGEPLGRIFSVSFQSRSPFSASLQSFCLTVRVYLNTQNYGLFCSLSLRKQAAFRDATISLSFPANDGSGMCTEIPHSWRINYRLSRSGSAFDWSCRAGNLFQRIGRTTQMWKVTYHQYAGISALQFLRLHSRRNQRTVESRNVDCFLMLLVSENEHVCQMMVSIIKKANKNINKKNIFKVTGTWRSNQLGFMTLR